MMITRLEPLTSGRETEIDMIERQMEGGVLIIQPPDAQNDRADDQPGGSIGVVRHVEVREMAPMVTAAPTD